MTIESMRDFAERGDPNVDVMVIKEEGNFNGQYALYLCAYIKQLSGIIVQCDSWDEKELIKELDASYNAFTQFAIREEIYLPLKLEYHFKYADMKEWMRK